MKSLSSKYRAVVAGSTGGIGRAFYKLLLEDENCGEVIGLSRSSNPRIDFTNEDSIYEAARVIGGEIHLFLDATGFLSDETIQPEKSLRAIDPAAMAKLFEINATGPALLMKHFTPLLPKQGRALFATLSARVGSISDNGLGGWYAYRASKAALNMLVKCTAIELARSRPEAVCVSLHPGTVETGLSDPFAGDRKRFTPEQSAAKMLEVLDALGSEETGSFHAYDGTKIPW